MTDLQPAEKKPAPARWTPEEEERLAEAYRGGTPLPHIAETHGRTLGAITSRLQMMDLISYGPYTALLNEDTATTGLENMGKPWTEEETAALLTTHITQGTPEGLEELALTLGRTPRSLILKLVALGAVQPAPNPNPQPKPRAEYKPPRLKKAAQPPEFRKPDAESRTVKISVTPEFQTALAAVQARENLLILGSAGTGKSTFLKWLKKNIEGTFKYAVLAPTGMAALNVGGQTIHSFFGLKPQLITNASGWHKPRNPKIYENLDLLIIDEISMVRADIFSAIETFLRKYGKHPGQPFGGCKLVLMGDLCQLPPVVRREETETFETLFATPFFFSSPAWEAGHFSIVEFTHIFRQTDAPFITLLNHIRHGNADGSVVDALNKRHTTEIPPGAVILAARNRTVDAINQRELEKLPGYPRTFTAVLTGNADANAFTTPVELVLKPGARVMFTRNDSVAQRWVNGSLAEVIKCGHEGVTVKLQSSGETHYVEPVKWEATKYALDENESPTAVVAGTFTQLPLTLAWALTIHKAQGQTLPSCVLDLSDGGTFAEGQLYVALSRARSLESIYLTQPIRQRDIRTNPAVIGFYDALAAARRAVA